MSVDYQFFDTNRWMHKRRKLLVDTNTKLIGKVRKYELPTFVNDDVSPFDGKDVQEQNDLCFKLVKDACLDNFTQAFYPYIDLESAKLKFKVGKHLHPEVRSNLSKLTSLIRPMIQIRRKLSDLYTNLTCGLVARTVYDCINDFLNLQFPSIVENLFNLTNGSLNQLVKLCGDLQQDVINLERALSKMYRFDMIGGQIVSLLDKQEYREFSRSFIPGLFKKCISNGMEHYNKFLHEFLYHGHINSDRFYEFPIWDLFKTASFTASDFRIIDEKHDLPFDRRFVVISDLIPSIWKTSNVREMVQNAMHTRRLISVLNAQNNEKFYLKEVVWSQDITVDEEYEHVKDANTIANEALFNKINDTFNIQQFYNLLDKILFNPSSMWLNDFVTIAEELMFQNADPDKFIDHLNYYFNSIFEKEFDTLNKRFDVIKLKLYNYGLFDKVLPSDQRLVDFLNVEIEIPNDDLTIGTDENDPVGPFSRSKLSEKESLYGLTRESSPMNTTTSDSNLLLIDQIGIEFYDTLLVKCLIPPQVQEHLNRLFRLRLKLATLDYLLTKKGFDKAEFSKYEQLFIFTAHGFIRRYLSTTFGCIASEQWCNFIKTTEKLKGVDSITKAQTFLIRNIFSPSGLYSGSTEFVNIFNQTINELDAYCRENDDVVFDEVATSFYKNYKIMRQIVYNTEHYKAMSYSIFRITPFIKLSTIESIEIDPRNGALAPTSNLKTVQRTASHRRSINIMPKRA